ncbi:MAG: hypothetical protein AAGH87_10805 [Pseudomonadota bacterium]
MMARWGLACLAVMAASCFGQAGAEPGGPGGDGPAYPISGSWTFVSFTGDACEFGGVARLGLRNDDGTYPCELTAQQVCPIDNVEWVVRQSCVATRTGNQLVIRSTIEEFLVGEPTPSYWPDNFVLKVKSSDFMAGSLISHGAHATQFKREVEGIS